MSRQTFARCAAAVLALVLAAYANHFGNSFHFDDSHSVVDNPALRSIRNVPRFFADATTFSILPLNQSYRPVLQTTLAVDYWLAGGYVPKVFQIDSFAWFLLQLGCMFGLFLCVLRTGASETDARLGALLAVAVYGLHPAGAETVNYVIQRGEILSTLGVVAALWTYAALPRARRWRLWIGPAVFGALAKPPALVLPVLMACYVLVVERPAGGRQRRAAWIDVGIATAVSLACGWWMASRTPPTYVTGAASPSAYWLSQPFVTLRYFATFFAPVGLSADNDWRAVSGLGDPPAFAGFAFLAAAVAAAVRAGRSPDTRPIAFGLWWFLIALLPTAVTPLAEIANDHRMFFPFVGLSLAVVWAAWLAVRRLPAAHLVRRAALPIVLVLLAGEAAGVRARNAVWRTEETLWRDVTEKSPTNGRGLMNYGENRMASGNYPLAIQYFERALAYTPNYELLHVNLGVAYGAMRRAEDAERSFRHAIALAPDDWRSHLYYARWLRNVGRLDEARAEALLAAAQNPADEASRTLAAQLSASQPTTADGFVSLSLAQYRAGRFRESIASAEAAIRLRPDYAEAYNNVAAGHNALGEWDKGIAAGRQAVALKPELEIARNNLAWATAQKQKGAAPGGAK
jgi:Flp pilus assembly protein TadD